MFTHDNCWNIIFPFWLYLSSTSKFKKKPFHCIFMIDLGFVLFFQWLQITIKLDFTTNSTATCTIQDSTITGIHTQPSNFIFIVASKQYSMLIFSNIHISLICQCIWAISYQMLKTHTTYMLESDHLSLQDSFYYLSWISGWNFFRNLDYHCSEPNHFDLIWALFYFQNCVWI